MFLSLGTATSMIVAVLLDLLRTTMSGLRAGITRSVLISKSHSILTSSVSVTASGWSFMSYNLLYIKDYMT